MHVQRRPFIPAFQDLRNLPDDAQLVKIQMTLMLAFEKLVVRAQILNRPLYLLSVWTMQPYPCVSDSFLLCLEASPISYTETSALEQLLPYFLASLSPPECVFSCALGNIIRFLITKNKSCRTVVHRPSLFWSCPLCLAAGSLDALLEILKLFLTILGVFMTLRIISNLFERKKPEGRLCLHRHCF